MDFWSAIFIIAAVIILIIICAVFLRNSNMGYRTGKGLFESSEFNLEEKDDVSDKEYYDGGKGLMK